MMVLFGIAAAILVLIALCGPSSPAARMITTRSTLDEYEAGERWPSLSLASPEVKPCPRCGRRPVIAMRYSSGPRESLYDAWLECNGDRGVLWPPHAKGLVNRFMADDGYGRAHSGRPSLRYLAAAWHEGITAKGGSR